VKHWHLPLLDGSSDKRTSREPGSDAPRVPSVGRQKPRVLFSSPECRLVLLDLQEGEDMPEHRVRERAVVEVISGRVSIEAGGETVECDAGTLVTFDPGERHAVHGLENARLLLVLAPWPAARHNQPSEAPHDQHLPANATIGPIEDVVSEHKRVLLVVDPTISDARVVRPSVRAVVERHPGEVYVIAPIFTTRLAWATNDDAAAIADAEQRLATTLQQLYDRDVEADGTVGGDVDVLTAIADALARFPADEIIIAVHADHDRHWRERDLADKIRSHHSQPLTELLVEANGTASVRT
jgi:quercetin dioxygenase-like cupin family protein